MMETLTSCPICHNASDRVKTILGLVFWRCRVCGVDYRSPRMDDAETARYYQHEYRVNCPVDDHDIRRQVDRAQNEARFMADLWTGETMLEVGCSAGKLIAEFAARGFACVGVDPDTRMPGAVASLDLIPPAPFDVICLAHTLEHINRPRDLLLRLVRDYSHNGTRVMIEVPNREVLTNTYLKHHPMAFDRASLRWLMESVGGREMRVCTYGGHGSYLLGMWEIA